MFRGRHIVRAAAFILVALGAAPAAWGQGDAFPAVQYRRSREIRLRVHPNPATPTVAPVAGYTLYVTADDGVTWRASTSGETLQTDSEFRFSAHADGRYGFRMVARDAAGNEGRTPTGGTVPEVLVVVDTAPPAVVLREPRDAQTIKKGSPVIVRWDATDANVGAAPVSIHVSYGGGSPVPVATSLHPSDSYAIHPPDDAEQMRIVVTATDLASNRSESKPVTIVLSKTGQLQQPTPFTTAVDKAPASARPSYDVWYEVKDIQPSGLREIDLWYTLDGGATWAFYGRDEDLTPPFHFEPQKPGKYGFYVVAIKKTGEASADEPTSGTSPQVSAIYDPLPPVVTLLGPRGDQPLKGGQPVDITWTATDDLFGEKPISLFYMMHPQRWEKIADLPNTGRFTWSVPKMDSTNLYLKISAVDMGGNVTDSDPVGPLTVDAQGKPIFLVHGIVQSPARGGPAPGEGPPRPLGAMELARRSYQRGLYFMEIDRDPMKAEQAFEEALKLYANYVDALNDLAVLWFKNGLYGKALDGFVRTKAANGADPQVILNLAACYQRLTRPDEALSELQILSQFPTLSPADATASAHLLLVLARDFLRMNNPSQARVAALLGAGLPNVPSDLVKTLRAYAP